MDTLTTLDKNGILLEPGKAVTIPVRFHMYWAGTDKDGAVAGFYWAVTETTLAQSGERAPMPAPLPPPADPFGTTIPGQYRFTTKTDTTFMFTVEKDAPDREHAFYIYAVDNAGKPDPTPARFFFNAIDKFPPRPVIDSTGALATGTIVTLSHSGLPTLQPLSKYITDSLVTEFPKDTVPARSRLDFRWRSEIMQAGTYVKEYRYKLDEDWQVVSPTVNAVSYGTGVPGSKDIPTGRKTFSLLAIDQSGGAISPPMQRYFVMNYVPETWWAGPDPASFPVSTDGEYGSRSVDVVKWPTGGENSEFLISPATPLTNGWEGRTFGPESLKFRPSRRFPPNWSYNSTAPPETWPRTFYEIYKGRLYARSEGDTVHMNSIVVLWNGGYDKDSPYTPKVARDTAGPVDPELRFANSRITGEAVEDDGVIGSPIGFRSVIVTRLTPLGLKNIPTESSLYPIYDPSSVYRAPRIGGYWRLIQAGKAYAVARAEDADKGVDNSVANPVELADDVDLYGGTPEEQRARREVLVFYVDKAPALVRTGSPQFLPYDNQVITTRQWNFNLRGMDLDPLDPAAVYSVVGGPTANTIIRYKVTLVGKDLAGRDTSWTYLTATGPYIHTGGETTPLSFTPGGTWEKNPFASGPIRVSIQICDCIDCERAPGQGRCVDGLEQDPDTKEWRVPDKPGFSSRNVITVQYTRPPEPALGNASPAGGLPGPDSVEQEILR